MKPKKRNVKGKTGQSLNTKAKTDPTDDTALLEKFKLKNAALEKIKSAVIVSNGNSQIEDE